MDTKNRLLFNLPPSFFTHPDLADLFDSVDGSTEVRKRSHNSADEIEEDLRWADSVVMWSWPDFTEELLEKIGDLKFVGQINSSRLTATNCLQRGIPLSEARHAWSPAVAEYALALILNGLRRVSDFHSEMRIGTEAWVQSFPEEVDRRERELSGASVGIVGFGGIGRRLAQLLRPFQVQLRVYDPFVSESVVSEHGGTSEKLDTLLEKSNIVVTCAANAADNQHMIGTRELALLPKGAILVNVARSMLFDTQALLEKAKEGEITVLLDVFDKEPLEQDSPFRALPNVYLSPHRAGGIIPSVQRSLEMLIADWKSTLEGTPRKCPITQEMLVCLP